jgi:hypothetical protein
MTWVDIRLDNYADAKIGGGINDIGSITGSVIGLVGIVGEGGKEVGEMKEEELMRYEWLLSIRQGTLTHRSVFENGFEDVFAALVDDGSDDDRLELMGSTALFNASTVAVALAPAEDAVEESCADTLPPLDTAELCWVEETAFLTAAIVEEALDTGFVGAAPEVEQLWSWGNRWAGQNCCLHF